MSKHHNSHTAIRLQARRSSLQPTLKVQYIQYIAIRYS